MTKAVKGSFRGALSAMLALLCAGYAFGQNAQTKSDLSRAFGKFDIVTINDSAAAEGTASKRRLAFTAAGRDFQLEVTPNDLRSARYRAENTGIDGISAPDFAGVNTFKGKIVGAADSEVRLTIDGASVEGFFETGGERLYIEPAAKYSPSAAAGEMVVYKAEDTLNKSDFFRESDVPTKIGNGTGLVQSSAVIDALPNYRVIEMATEADLEFVQTLGGASQANSEILSILNMVEGTYNAELGLSIRVVYQHTWTAADPYAGATTNDILNAFTNYWNANYPTASVPRDAAHLFSGKSVAASRGLAWVGVICSSPQYSYGLSGFVGWAPGKYLVPAHEIGHNLGGNHAEAAQNCANSLMNATLSGSTPLSFCTYSQNEINGFVGANGSCLPAQPPPGLRSTFDFDGDGKSDQAVFRPSTGGWYINRSSNGFNAFQFGIATDKAVSADFDGDGKSDAAVYRAGAWYIFNSATGTVTGRSFGIATDVPVPADFNGDGKADIAVFRPAEGNWYMLSSVNEAFSSVRFGSAEDVPVPADFDGDGKADVNVFRTTTGAWYRLNSSNGAFAATQFGTAGDKPLIGDFDGDAKADVAVYRPSNGGWYVLRSSNGSFYGTVFGLATDVPAVGDFDGDGKSDVSVFRPSDGTWYRLNSANGQFNAVRFGQNGDQPIEGFYVR